MSRVVKWLLPFLAVASLAAASRPDGYEGTSFSELREKLLAPVPAQLDGSEPEKELEVYRRGGLPDLRVGAGVLFKWLRAAARHAVSGPGDWEPRLPKLVHPIGICFTGEWRIDETSPYSGAFAPGFRGLFIGRASVADGQARAGRKRPFGFAGKIFPTVDPGERVPTLNFVTIDNLGGTKAKHFLDVSLSNEPDPGFAITPFPSLAIFLAFTAADRDIFRRPITHLAGPELRGGPKPRLMRLRARPGTPRVDEPDFRRELEVARYPGGITLEIAVSASGKKALTRIGEIALLESAVSYACDRQLRFAHPRASGRR